MPSTGLTHRLPLTIVPPVSAQEWFRRPWMCCWNEGHWTVSSCSQSEARSMPRPSISIPNPSPTPRVWQHTSFAPVYPSTTDHSCLSSLPQHKHRARGITSATPIPHLKAWKPEGLLKAIGVLQWAHLKTHVLLHNHATHNPINPTTKQSN